MNIKIFPSDLAGTVVPPPSKSITQRAYAAALLQGGKVVIHNPGSSDDELAARSIVEQLGARLTQVSAGAVRVDATFPAPARPGGQVLFCRESGLSLRMFTPIAALSDRPVTITGSGSLLRRPVQLFEDVLPRLGVSFESSQGSLPLRIRGPLKPGDIEIEGAISSQFVTGLLMAFSVAGASNTVIKVNNLVSRPYIALTFEVMKAFNLRVPDQGADDHFYFSGADHPGAPHTIREYTVAADWSNAAFLLVAGAIAGRIVVRGLDLFSAQGDKKILEVLRQCGCRFVVKSGNISIVPPDRLVGFHFDARDCPDLFPPLVALASYCSGASVITGVHRLIHKESNRAEALRSEFSKLGIAIRIRDDDMVIGGNSTVRAGRVTAHQDHRVAMALSVAALKAEGPVCISQADAVNKSYPDFYTDLRTLGVRTLLFS